MRRLLIRPGALGDCLLCFPAMQSLTADYTEIWVPSAVVPLVGFAHRVCAISSTGLDLLGIGGDPATEQSITTRLGQFDQIVTWYGTNRKEFRMAMRSTRVPCTFLRALPLEQMCCHAADYFCSQVGAPFGQVPKLSLPTANRRNTVVIHPFSGSASKNWPLERYRELAQRLPLPVEWVAGPEEVLPGARRFDNLADLAAWISGAALYMGNDSGVTHLAAATGTRTVALFGPSDPSKWSPRGPNVYLVNANPMADFTTDKLVRELTRLGITSELTARAATIAQL